MALLGISCYIPCLEGPVGPGQGGLEGPQACLCLLAPALKAPSCPWLAGCMGSLLTARTTLHPLQIRVKWWDGQDWIDVGGNYRVDDEYANGPVLAFAPDTQAPVVAYTDKVSHWTVHCER